MNIWHIIAKELTKQDTWYLTDYLINFENNYHSWVEINNCNICKWTISREKTKYLKVN